jgi:hypothetical protein
MQIRVILLRPERDARRSRSVHSAPIGRLAFPGACLKFWEEKKGKRRRGDVGRENSGTRRAEVRRHADTRNILV